MNEAGHLTSETIDLLMLSSLAKAECDRARAHLSSCASCKARWSETEDDWAHFDRHVLPRTLAAVKARARPLASMGRWLADWWS